ncbi:Mrx9p KNAG_0K01730 [Huiozyma naganishii CBS 8797]|uniref:Uncharacterized protein n=1 Tax=Huiozyma naganishii (strain ATCC MYA-139 / BCRC 22969 / CBS 8797 / KCTC 17520 / NBRC 10181 / NCYC 3082 / Yp74L-3) TaxID=1071383 RepID=J7RRR0_HUIN7|nr:hypothetical protein KNAG_0K01730 [Kazachstania naganishii CBS 8797]CCK72538.1 hypothetical protein KNAG_0K01730 [Kazachstania naganishii CBS 8797]
MLPILGLCSRAGLSSRVRLLSVEVLRKCQMRTLVHVRDSRPLSVARDTRPRLTVRWPRILFKGRANLTIRRNFNERGGGLPQGGGPKIRYYRISMVPLLIFSTVTLMVFVIVLPVLLKLFFPVILVAIIVYQFKKWQRNQLYSRLMKYLPKSDLYTTKSQFMSLRRSFGLLSNEAVVGKSVEFTNFVKTRIMEALAKDTMKIRSTLIKPSWIPKNAAVEEYQLTIGLNRVKMFAKALQGQSKAVFSVEYPLFFVTKLEDRTKQSHLMGKVCLHFLYDYSSILKNSAKSFDPETLFKQMNDTESKVQYVISVIQTGTLSPKPFILYTRHD